METRMGELRCKEVINVNDGSRYGYVSDVALDLETGKMTALIVQGRPRLFGLLGHEPDRLFSWPSVRCFGEDIILVDSVEESGEEFPLRVGKEGKTGK